MLVGERFPDIDIAPVKLPPAEAWQFESRPTGEPLPQLDAVRVARFVHSLTSVQDQTLPGPLDRNLGGLRAQLFHNCAAAPAQGFVKGLRPFLAGGP